MLLLNVQIWILYGLKFHDLAVFVMSCVFNFIFCNVCLAPYNRWSGSIREANTSLPSCYGALMMPGSGSGIKHEQVACQVWVRVGCLFFFRMEGYIEKPKQF